MTIRILYDQPLPTKNHPSEQICFIDKIQSVLAINTQVPPLSRARAGASRYGENGSNDAKEQSRRTQNITPNDPTQPSSTPTQKCSKEKESKQ